MSDPGSNESRDVAIEVNLSDADERWLLADGSLGRDAKGDLRATDKMVGWLHEWFEQRLKAAGR